MHLNLGIDKKVLQHIDEATREAELARFDLLGIMLLLVSTVAGLAGWVFVLLIAHSLLVASAMGVLIGLLIFNLYRMMLVTSINAYHTPLWEVQRNHELLYQHIHVAHAAAFDEADIREMVAQRRQQLRQLTSGSQSYRHDNAQMVNLLLKMVILAIMALVFATGLELFIFRNQLNESFEAIRQVYATEPDSWIVRSALAIPSYADFSLLECNSVLFAIDVLRIGLGGWKTGIDLLVVLLFIIPLILTYRSHEIIDSLYVREQALSEISISHLHYLSTQVACYQIEQELASQDLSHLLSSSTPTAE